jgi:hypothetical protein
MATIQHYTKQELHRKECSICGSVKTYSLSIKESRIYIPLLILWREYEDISICAKCFASIREHKRRKYCMINNSSSYCDGKNVISVELIRHTLQLLRRGLLIQNGIAIPSKKIPGYAENSTEIFYITRPFLQFMFVEVKSALHVINDSGSITQRLDLVLSTAH